MMDEFEMFRARAYGGGLGGGCPRQGLLQGNEDDEESATIAAMRSKSKRRHSSVGIVGVTAETYGALGMAAAVNNYESSRNADAFVRGSDGGGGVSGDRWKNKPRLPSQVTVAIEPPSPTDPHCGGGSGDDYGPLRSRTKQHQRAADDDEDADDDDYDGDEEGRASKKTHYRPGRQNLQRTHTAPPHTRSPSPRRQRANGDSQRHLEDHGGSNRTAGGGGGGGRGGVEQNSSQLDDSSDDGGPSQPQRNEEAQVDIRRRSPSVKRGRPSSKGGDQGQRRDSRPDNLRPNALSPGVGGGGSTPSRRKSVTCATDGLRLTQPSPSSHRRNSYTGAVALALKPNSPPSGAGFNTGRRGSAITYLTDAPSPGLGWRQPSPAGSPSRRKSCVEDIGRDVEHLLGRTSSAGGLNPDEFRNHLENLARAAAEAVAGSGSNVNSRASSINHRTSNRPSIVGSPSAAGSGSTTSSSESPPVYRVMVLGAQGVGKTTLANQLMTSEYLANKENHQGKPVMSHVLLRLVFVCLRNS